jgi:tRNA threonylcarbamoyladenosine biosynthesis protein TsaB
MLTLGIETAADHGAVGLCLAEKFLGESSFSARLGQAERLVPAIESLLKLNGLDRRELQLIAVATGPGSFTGLRIGMATAKGLSQALQIPLVGVASTEAFAWRAGARPIPVCVLLADRRDLVYSALFEHGEKIAPERSHTIESLAQELRAQGRAIFCIGTGAETHRALLEQNSFVEVAPALLNLPSAMGIARLGYQRYITNRQDELWTLEPLYVQRPIAEASRAS